MTRKVYEILWKICKTYRTTNFVKVDNTYEKLTKNERQTV